MTAPTPELISLETYMRFAAALAGVLVLIAAAGWVLRRLASSGALGSALLSLGPGRPQRLAVVEVRALDVRRRLVLVRRDDVEHLLLLGATQDLVIETGIAANRPPPEPPTKDTQP